MKKKSEYLIIIFNDPENAEEVLRQLAEDVKEECAKKCESEVDTIIFDNGEYKRTLPMAIRNLKLFEGDSR